MPCFDRHDPPRLGERRLREVGPLAVVGRNYEILEIDSRGPKGGGITRAVAEIERRPLGRLAPERVLEEDDVELVAEGVAPGGQEVDVPPASEAEPLLVLRVMEVIVGHAIGRGDVLRQRHGLGKSQPRLLELEERHETGDRLAQHDYDAEVRPAHLAHRVDDRLAAVEVRRRRLEPDGL